MLYLILFLVSIYTSIFVYIVHSILQENKNQIGYLESRVISLSKYYNEIYNYIITLEKDKLDMLQRIQDLEEWIENASATDDDNYNNLNDLTNPLNNNPQEQNIIITRESPFTTYISNTNSTIRHRTSSY